MLKSNNEIIIESWAHLCDEVYHDSWQPDLGRYRTNFAFRGLSDKNYELRNGFRRNCGKQKELEYHMLRNFRKYARTSEQGLTKTQWRLLVLAQHHGLPTRLLDWTYSPFVAMHFATAITDNFDRDGIIWKVDFVKVNQSAPKIFRDALEKEKCNAFTVEMIEELIPDLKAFDELIGDPFAIFFEPPSIDERIVNQYAFFSVISDYFVDFEEILFKNPDYYRKIIIPKELKWEIRDKLDQANINERLLFPGLDGLASWLKRHYLPRS